MEKWRKVTRGRGGGLGDKKSVGKDGVQGNEDGKTGILGGGGRGEEC